ncbi:MAG TPA: hypothetical protein VFR68_05585 [Candidatus Dormibacteraeota bacterium]|nr:hypothetical protein [Candidatus Dormibacteraeota bacterium]
MRSIPRPLRWAAQRITLWAVLAYAKGALRLLHASGHGQLYESLRRKQWFYRAGYSVFRHPHVLGASRVPGRADVEIATRLITAWERATRADGADTAGMWSSANQELRELLEPIEKNDPDHLANVLTGMFHSRFIQGMAHGFRHREWVASRRLVPMTIEDRLVSLAEYLGIVPAETSEQGESAAAARNGLEDLVVKLERALGHSLAFPEVGAPSGIRVADRLLTMRSMEHIYAAARIKRGARLAGLADEAPISAVEIGGGYGGLCYWITLQFVQRLRRYRIVDLAWVNVIQGYFLCRALGADRVSLFGEPPRQIEVLPTSAVEALPAMSPAKGETRVVINQDSLPEMLPEVARAYLRWTGRQSGALFYSYQQESANRVNGIPQNIVHQLCTEVPSLRLLARDLSWTRDGYTEELYRVA